MSGAREDEIEGSRTVRNAYYLGLSETVAKEADSLKGSVSANAGQYYLYRSMCLSNPTGVFSKIPDSAPIHLRAVKLLASYKNATEETKEMIFDTLNEWLSTDMLRNELYVQLVAYDIYFEERNYKDALKIISPVAGNIEK
jgi:hypothetical protein